MGQSVENFDRFINYRRNKNLIYAAFTAYTWKTTAERMPARCVTRWRKSASHFYIFRNVKKLVRLFNKVVLISIVIIPVFDNGFIEYLFINERNSGD